MKVNPTAPEDRVLVLAAEVLQAGGIVVYPTETLYGIGANAWNPEAIAKIHRLKRRRENKPILVLVATEEAIRGLVVDISPSARTLMKEYWPGPLTIVFAAAPDVPAGLTQGTGTIGIRIPSSGLCRSLVQLCGCPVTSTSANVSGGNSPQSVAGIETALGAGVDLYLDGGMLPPSLPSTVVDVSGSRPRLIRAGAIAAERLKQTLPDIIL
jgi:L-threonylcarbamoyladenylate synthase